MSPTSGNRRVLVETQTSMMILALFYITITISAAYLLKVAKPASHLSTYASCKQRVEIPGIA